MLPYQGGVKSRRRLSGMNRRGIAFHAGIIGGMAVLTVVLTYPLIFHLTSHIPYHKDLDRGVGDHWQILWAFDFVERLVESRRWSLFTDTLFYPRGVDLTYPLLFGIGFPLAVAIPFVRFLGPVLTYNLFIIGSFILIGYTSFLLVHYLTHNNRASFVAAIVFAFSPYHMARSLGHFNLLITGMLIPLYILFFLRAVKDGHVLDLLFAPLIFALAVVSNPYYAVFLMFFSIIYIFYERVSDTNSIDKNVFLNRLLFMGGVGAFFLLPLAWLILVHPADDASLYLPPSESFRWSADLFAFFVPSRHHTLWGDLVKPLYDRFTTRFSGNDTEQTVYIGYTVMALALVAVVKAPKRETRLWLYSGLAFFVLSLGPFLHVNGKDLLKVDGMPITLPLPALLLQFSPGLRGVRVSSRFSLMLMMALTVLAGYGIKHLLMRQARRSWTVPLLLGCIGTAIICEDVIVPLPLADARISKVYQRIAQAGKADGTLLDVPLYWTVFRYEYDQTVHRKRLLLGQAPRLSTSLVTTYANSVPFMKLFKNPEMIYEYEQRPVDRRDILMFIEFFDLSFIVLHKEYLGEQGTARFLRFLLTHFPVMHMEEDGQRVVLELAKDGQSAEVWRQKDGNVVDFGAPTPQFFLAEGWSPPERWGDQPFAWSDARASQLWVYRARVEDLSLVLRLLPFTFPGSPPQGIKIYVNGRLLGHLPLATNDWQRYAVHLPQSYLTRGINAFRFVYDYTASPAQVWPGSEDRRELGVAFDFIAFHPE